MDEYSPASSDESPVEPRVTVTPDGPYRVGGPVAVTRKAVVTSADGESLAWSSPHPLPGPQGGGTVDLCRCGQSANKPFCDGSHQRLGFDGSESAEPEGPYDENARSLGGSGFEVRDYQKLCIGAAFCENRATSVWDLVPATENPVVRGLVMSMVDHCPSGRLTYRLGPDQPDNEPDLPVEIAAVTDGPLWLTGSVPVTLADGSELPTRNRVVLCRCGHSRNKPLCDGSHIRVDFRDGPAASA
ncbi:CDGSH iron-sulfur domain-containing protein [Kitasatospora sp. MAP5-34]|uniref:CDGSH iron-sulfur domain-containing protein n=1 Tax=Kitasatospora sp. MAP5-34 TaxID=3035102 RepID=UPI0024757365|nr:CDGSH iron-sulfur domain-containing protein [Kitasatospora sp. MAP5-34]